MRRSLVGLLTLALAATGLAACAPEADDEPSPTPSATETPAPPTDEEVEAEAIEAIAGFQDDLAAMRAAGQNTYTELLDHASPVAASQAVADAQEIIDAGYTIVGAPQVIAVVRLPGSDLDALAATVVACSDVSGVQVLDPAGIDHNDPNRDMLVELVVHLSRQRAEDPLLVDREEPWDAQGESPCGDS